MNYCVNICYKGTDFCGYQLQPKGRTVAGEIRSALTELFGSYTDLAGCSRTDSGVHANDYCFSFKAEKTLPPDTVVKALNNKLPYDVRVKSCRYADDDFHARYSVKAKEYLYVIYTGETASPFYAEYSHHYPRPLDLERMNAAAEKFVGTHDFSAFKAAGSKDVDPVRTIYSASFERKGDVVEFRIRGDGFLYKMVRLTVGCLLKVAEGKISPEDIDTMLFTGKNILPYTVEAKGLFLNKVLYE